MGTVHMLDGNTRRNSVETAACEYATRYVRSRFESVEDFASVLGLDTCQALFEEEDVTCMVVRTRGASQAYISVTLSEEESKFALLHCIGHHVLHSRGYPSGVFVDYEDIFVAGADFATRTYTRKECEANMFANVFAQQLKKKEVWLKSPLSGQDTLRLV